MRRSYLPRPSLLRPWYAGLLLVLLLAAILPSALRLDSKGKDAVWAQVCTPHGMRWVAIASNAASNIASNTAGDVQHQGSSKSQAAMGLLDCPLCLLQHSAALPSGNLPPQLAAVQWQGRLLVFTAPALAPALGLRHWRPPLRGPPVFSHA